MNRRTLAYQSRRGLCRMLGVSWTYEFVGDQEPAKLHSLPGTSMEGQLAVVCHAAVQSLTVSLPVSCDRRREVLEDLNTTQNWFSYRTAACGRGFRLLFYSQISCVLWSHLTSTYLAIALSQAARWTCQHLVIRIRSTICPRSQRCRYTERTQNDKEER